MSEIKNCMLCKYYFSGMCEFGAENIEYCTENDYIYFEPYKNNNPIN